MAEYSEDAEVKLEWWEKKQGITFAQKKKKVESKLARKKKREEEREKKAAEGIVEEPKKKSVKTAKNKSATVKKNDKSDSGRKKKNGVCVAKNLGYLFDLISIDEDGRKVIENFEKIVSDIYPLSSKQKALLPGQIRALSHELTDEREDRRVGYMNETTTLSAYIHYYLWWNIVRLTRLFANLPDDFFNLKDGSICLDAGSGPLTVPIAIMIARPELRNKKITWYCMDISSQALLAGENIYLSVSSALHCEPWNIIRVGGELGTTIKDKIDFLTCANLFNEIVQNHELPPDFLAKKYALQLLSYIDKKNDDARIFVVEPGVPACGRFLSLLRSALMKRHFYPTAPCTHCAECPMNGKKGGKWCNFSFSTEDAPKSLRAFSKSIYIPKERAVLSFIAAKKIYAENEDDLESLVPAGEDRYGNLSFRITSDPISLPGNRTGYYACSSKGLLLVISDTRLRSGECLETKLTGELYEKDEKSGAYILNLK